MKYLFNDISETECLEQLINITKMASYTEDNGMCYICFPENIFTFKGLNLSNMLLLGLEKRIKNKENVISLFDDVHYIKNEYVEVWIKPETMTIIKEGDYNV